MIKRSFDVFFSLLGLILLFPLFLVVSILIKLSSQGPILFKQLRVGRNGEKFYLYKFRSMVKDAEQKGPKLTTEKDARVTKIGAYLRKYKLDELPQLLNVLKGEMSFVGPRPEVPEYVEMFNDDYVHILKVKPGITDFAAIKFRKESESDYESIEAMLHGIEQKLNPNGSPEWMEEHRDLILECIRIVNNKAKVIQKFLGQLNRLIANEREKDAPVNRVLGERPPQAIFESGIRMSPRKTLRPVEPE